jgi:hypothetical protein
MGRKNPEIVETIVRLVERWASVTGPGGRQAPSKRKEHQPSA